MTASRAEARRSDAGEIDLDAIRAKYRIERDKRLRKEGIAQYRTYTDVIETGLDDPFAEPGFSRAPVKDDPEVVILGGGFCGLTVAARLRQQGFERIRIVEVASDFGGTWYWNRYPGVQCDIESYIYLPLLEELGTMPTLKYVYGPEILEHARALGRHFDLYRDALFSTRVTRLEWDEGAARWQVETDRGDRLRARFVVVASGPLSRPKLPGIPGIEDFEGHTFHTSRWDYAYTGGDSTGGLVGLRDKRVGVIGTGATAIQCIPHLGEWSRHLTVFQRTPSCVDSRRNVATHPAWFASLAPGWQRERIWNFSTTLSGRNLEVDLVNDGWTDIMRNLAGMLGNDDGSLRSPEEIAREVELADARKMEEIRARVAGIVKDPATAAALKPWYRQFCKRPCFHDDYLETFNRPNVTLVDTDGRGVDAITKTGAVVAGREYPLDCLVFATGFEVGTDYARRADCEIVGRGGVTLTERWASGVRTLHGLFTREFPNCILMGGLQSGLTPNFTELYDEQSRHVADVLAHVRAKGATRVEVGRAAEAAWVEAIQQPNPAQLEFAASCTPGYYNNEGRPTEGPGWFGGTYGGGPQAYFELLRDWREGGDYAGLELGGGGV
ncbi:MAG: NAD(P)/FAD-dependent oxidoreductase [Spirochaetaceae bacterium]|nr:NAD(P)/FAD-dependent oxidoreductase [Myxococcales bacterium]MCB9723261.1 NAD(P)/FAD-dependent oxidoreductase [Spirochaetaceae bacterium]